MANIKESTVDIVPVKKETTLPKGTIVKKEGVPVKLKQATTIETTADNESLLRLKEILRKKIKEFKKQKNEEGIKKLKERMKSCLVNEVTLNEAFTFDKVKGDKNSWYNNPEMMGHVWAKETLDSIEQVCKKYANTPFQKYITANAFDFNNIDWHYFTNWITKKYVRQVQYVMKNSATMSPLDLLRWLNSNSGLSKSNLDWALEYASYMQNKDIYQRYYVKAYGFYGMRPEEAKKRLENYIAKLRKQVVHPEWIPFNTNK